MSDRYCIRSRINWLYHLTPLLEVGRGALSLLLSVASCSNLHRYDFQESTGEVGGDKSGDDT